MTADRWALRRHFLLSLTVTLVLPCLGSGTAWAAPVAVPSAQALRRVDNAKDRLDGLRALQAQAEQARRRAEAIGEAGESLGRQLDDARATDAAAQAALQTLADCLPGLSRETTAGAPSLLALTQSLTQSHQAVQTVARVGAAALKPAVLMADRAFEERARAERLIADARRRVDAETQACLRALDEADQRVRSAWWSAQWLQSQAQALPATAQQLREQFDALQRAADAAAAKQWLSYRAAGVAWPGAERLLQLQQAAAALPAEMPALSREAWSALQSLGADWQARSVELAQLEDAAAYLDLMSDAAARDCVDGDCLSGTAERTALDARLQAARQALAEAQRRLADATGSLQSLLDARLAHLSAARQRTDGVAPAVAPARADAAQFSARALGHAGALMAAVDPAVVAARREWEAAYRLAYGQPPPAEVVTSHASAAASMARPSMAPPELVSHAWQFIPAWNTERAGFGAYTYVILRKAADLKRPDVLRRYSQLLAVLQREREAASVSAAEARQVNLFCIPNRAGAGERGTAPEAAYADDLGWQLLFRAQSGLLTRPEVKARLIQSSGPFLITLPGRIADARSGTPLLFADLGDYPDDSIADLVGHYMGSLLTDFPRDQALWRPALKQRVALAMISLASDAGGLVFSLIPSAQAAPR